MNKQPILSICIPTLNRGDFISETLDSITSQITNDIEIIILDGGSTDNTKEVVQYYLNNYSYIKYSRLHDKNQFDHDLELTVSKANGIYCWLFSDDDIVKPGAIDILLSNLALSPDLVILNSEIKDKQLIKILRPSFLKIKNDRSYFKKDFENFFVDIADYLSFFGGVVIKKSVWDSRNKTNYFGTRFLHVGVILQKYFQNNIKVIAQPLISIRYGNASWSAQSFYYSLIVWPNLIWSFDDISDTAKKQVCNKDFSKSLFTLILFRARGSYSVDEYNKYFKDLFSQYSIIKYFSYLIALFPGYFLNSILYIYFTFFKIIHKNSEFYLLDLKSSRFFYKNFLGIFK